MAKIKKEKIASKKVEKVVTEKKKIIRKLSKVSLPKKAVVKAVRKAVKAPKPLVHKIVPKKKVAPLPSVELKKPPVASPVGGVITSGAVAVKEVIKKEKPPLEKIHKKEDKAAVLERPLPVAAPAVKPRVFKKEEKKPPLVEEQPKPVTPALELTTLELELPVTLKDLAVKLQEKPSVLIKTLMGMGLMVGINQVLDEVAATKICEKYKYRIKKAPDQEEALLRRYQVTDRLELLQPRAPVVTFMGHVDHGKTSLLDAIRKTKVVEAEHGGITQHIGAYRVVLPEGEITFLDTPGHEAFTAMRARGASITDIVVLVVAADDGVMPQTEEAIDHARAAGVPIIVALNKVDKPQANIDKVKKQLAELNLAAEDWGGKTITVAVSAKTGRGVNDLLEMILLETQMLELKANAKRPAKGVVVEAKMSKGRGPVATLLIQNGTLHLNDNIIVGKYYGKIRAMFNDHGHSATEASPSVPVEILGLTGIPGAGEPFFAIEDERQARELALLRQEKEKQKELKTVKRISLEDLHAQIQEGKLKELKLIIKADVQGSLEAIKDVLNKINTAEIKLSIIHEGIGSINSSDVILAVASNALILGFNITADERAKELTAKEGVEVRTYNIIYELGNDIKAALEGMLEPKLKKVFQGRAEIRKVFKLTKAGSVAGCFVSKGKIVRTTLVNIIRNGEVVFEGKLSSLKRFKDDVREVLEGFECGMAFLNFNDFMEGDTVESYDIEKIARRL